MKSHCASGVRSLTFVWSICSRHSSGRFWMPWIESIFVSFRKMYFSLAELVLSRKCYRYIACREDILSSARNALLEY